MLAVIQCTDKVGLVATIATLMEQKGINIIAMREYVDTAQNLFFARIELQAQETAATELEISLKHLLPDGAYVKVNPNPLKKMVVLVTKEYHCLGDILLRNHFQTLGATVEAVIGNHAVLGNICEKFGVPFHYVSHEGISKEQFEQNLERAISHYQFDFIVLAKFMRILSAEWVAKYPFKIINIHHSFLPAFIGANPYKQAHERGVKIIGATAHFVTNALDEGPIITQQVAPVNHNYTVTDMVKAGKEIEKNTLAKALQLVLEDRVFVYNNKTVVFE
ncbi:MAG: formyltetrahydrofolate deformylase [Chitinophagaceae bacterium]